MKIDERRRPKGDVTGRTLEAIVEGDISTHSAPEPQQVWAAHDFAPSLLGHSRSLAMKISQHHNRGMER